MIPNKDENIENTKSEEEAKYKVQNVQEIKEDKVWVEIANTQTKAEQQDKNVGTNETSKNQQHKKTAGNGRRKAVEEPKYSDSEQQGEDDKTYSFRSASTRETVETKKRVKEDSISSELTQEKNTGINNRHILPLYNRLVKTEVECGICSRWFH